MYSHIFLKKSGECVYPGQGDSSDGASGPGAKAYTRLAVDSDQYRYIQHLFAASERLREALMEAGATFPALDFDVLDPQRVGDYAESFCVALRSFRERHAPRLKKEEQQLIETFSGEFRSAAYTQRQGNQAPGKEVFALSSAANYVKDKTLELAAVVERVSEELQSRLAPRVARGEIAAEEPALGAENLRERFRRWRNEVADRILYYSALPICLPNQSLPTDKIAQFEGARALVWRKISTFSVDVLLENGRTASLGRWLVACAVRSPSSIPQIFEYAKQIWKLEAVPGWTQLGARKENEIDYQASSSLVGKIPYPTGSKLCGVSFFDSSGQEIKLFDKYVLSCAFGGAHLRIPRRTALIKYRVRFDGSLPELLPMLSGLPSLLPVPDAGEPASQAQRDKQPTEKQVLRGAISKSWVYDLAPQHAELLGAAGTNTAAAYGGLNIGPCHPAAYHLGAQYLRAKIPCFILAGFVHDTSDDSVSIVGHAQCLVASEQGSIIRDLTQHANPFLRVNWSRVTPQRLAQAREVFQNGLPEEARREGRRLRMEVLESLSEANYRIGGYLPGDWVQRADIRYRDYSELAKERVARMKELSTLMEESLSSGDASAVLEYIDTVSIPYLTPETIKSLSFTLQSEVNEHDPEQMLIDWLNRLREEAVPAQMQRQVLSSLAEKAEQPLDSAQPFIFDGEFYYRPYAQLTPKTVLAYTEIPLLRELSPGVAVTLARGFSSQACATLQGEMVSVSPYKSSADKAALDTARSLAEATSRISRVLAEGDSNPAALTLAPQQLWAEVMERSLRREQDPFTKRPRGLSFELSEVLGAHPEQLSRVVWAALSTSKGSEAYDFAHGLAQSAPWLVSQLSAGEIRDHLAVDFAAGLREGRDYSSILRALDILGIRVDLAPLRAHLEEGMRDILRSSAPVLESVIAPSKHSAKDATGLNIADAPGISPDCYRLSPAQLVQAYTGGTAEARIIRSIHTICQRTGVLGLLEFDSGAGAAAENSLRSDFRAAVGIRFSNASKFGLITLEQENPSDGQSSGLPLAYLPRMTDACAGTQLSRSLATELMRGETPEMRDIETAFAEVFLNGQPAEPEWAARVNKVLIEETPFNSEFMPMLFVKKELVKSTLKPGVSSILAPEKYLAVCELEARLVSELQRIYPPQSDVHRKRSAEDLFYQLDERLHLRSFHSSHYPESFAFPALAKPIEHIEATLLPSTSDSPTTAEHIGARVRALMPIAGPASEGEQASGKVLAKLFALEAAFSSALGWTADISDWCQTAEMPLVFSARPSQSSATHLAPPGAVSWLKRIADAPGGRRRTFAREFSVAAHKSVKRGVLPGNPHQVRNTSGVNDERQEVRAVFGGIGLGGRPYVPGDDVRRIDWNAAARMPQGLVVREIEATAERRPSNLKILAELEWLAGDSNLGGPQLCERIVRLASTLKSAISAGRRIELHLWFRGFEFKHEYDPSSPAPRARNFLAEVQKDLESALGRIKEYREMEQAALGDVMANLFTIPAIVSAERDRKTEFLVVADPYQRQRYSKYMPTWLSRFGEVKFGS